MLLHVLQPDKVSASKLIHYFSSHLVSGPIWHIIIALIFLPKRGLIRVFLTLRLALVQLFMPHWIKRSLFLIPEYDCSG